jgi:platelet-activating factor acetylhydrolase IB subunit alpha
MHLKGTHTHVIECVKFLSPRHAEKLWAQINNPDKKKNIAEKNTNQHYEFLLSAGRDKIIVLWNLTTQENLFTLQGHDNWIKDIALHPNGINFYSCSDDKTIRTWDILSAKEI